MNVQCVEKILIFLINKKIFILNIKKNFLNLNELVKNLTSSTLEKLSIISRAREFKKDITFLTGQGFLHDGVPKLKKALSKSKRMIIMTPYYLFTKDNKEMVLGSIANPNFDYNKEENSSNKKKFIVLSVFYRKWWKSNRYNTLE